MKRGYADIPEGQVHYRFDGKGDPIVLIHQTPSSSDEYSLVVPLLAKNHRVIAPDTLGFGMSDPPPGVFKIQDYARTAQELLKAIGIKKATVIGHHTGASIAAEIAAAYPGFVDKLILSGCPYYEPEVRKARLADARFQPMQITDDAAHVMKLWGVIRQYNPKAGAVNWQRTLIAGLLAGPRGEEAHHAVFEYEIESRLKSLKCPVLLLSGTEDTFYSKLEATKKLIPRCRVAEIPGGDPMITLTKPAEFAAAVLDFIKNPGI
jgi:pimeloyl-ACP methyl ester carboxylesterase